MNNSQKLEAITANTLIVGVDIAKTVQWARFTDYRGLEIGKALKFNNNKEGFESILASIKAICKFKNLGNIIVGMEPTGHYWKTLANHLVLYGITVVTINPYHTKRTKELDDNSPTKSDKKDALTIARLVRDGRYYEVYMPHDIFAELRGLSNARISLMKRYNALKNTITTVLDEYFPEIVPVFKNPLKGKFVILGLNYLLFKIWVINYATGGLFVDCSVGNISMEEAAKSTLVLWSVLITV